MVFRKLFGKKQSKRGSKSRSSTAPRNKKPYRNLLAIECLEDRTVLDAHTIGGLTFVASNDFVVSSNGFGVTVQGGTVALGFEPVGGYAANPSGFLGLLRIDLSAYTNNPGILAISDSTESFDLEYANIKLIDRNSLYPSLYTNPSATVDTFDIAKLQQQFGIDLTHLKTSQSPQPLPVATFSFTPEAFLIVDIDPNNDTTADSEVWFQGSIGFTSLMQADAAKGQATILPSVAVNNLNYVRTSPTEGFKLDGFNVAVDATNPFKLKGMDLTGKLSGTITWTEATNQWDFSISGGIKNNDEQGLFANFGIAVFFSLTDGDWSSLGFGLAAGIQINIWGTAFSSSPDNPLGAIYTHSPDPTIAGWKVFGEADFEIKGAVDTDTFSITLGYLDAPGIILDGNSNFVSFDGYLAADLHFFGAEWSSDADPLHVVYSRDNGQYQISGTTNIYVPNKAEAKSTIQIQLGDGTGNIPGFTFTEHNLLQVDAAITGAINVNGLTWGVQDARLQWNSETDDQGVTTDRFVISGELFFRELWSVDVVLGSSINGPNSGLRIENGDYRLDAFSVTIANVNLGLINLKEFEVKYGPDVTTGDTTVLVAANVFFPKSNVDVEGSITYDITQRRVTEFSFGLEAISNKRIPLPGTGLFLVGFYVDVVNPGQKESFVVKGDVSVEYGEVVSGGPLGSGVVTAAATGEVTVTQHEFILDADVWFGAKRKQANPGDFKVEYTSQFGHGNGTLTLDWQAHVYSLDVTSSFFSDALELDALVHFSDTSSEYSLLFEADAKIKVPKVVPFVGGQTLTEMAMVLDIHSTKGLEQNLVNGFMAAWIDVNLIVKHVEVGFKSDLSNDGFQNVQLIGQKQIDELKAGDFSFSYQGTPLYTYSTEFQANGPTQDSEGIPSLADSATLQVQLSALEGNIEKFWLEFRPYNQDGTLPAHSQSNLVDITNYVAQQNASTWNAIIQKTDAFPTINGGSKVQPLLNKIHGVFDFYIQTEEQLDPTTQIVWQVTYSSPAPQIELANAGGLKSGISTEAQINIPVNYSVASGLAPQSTITIYVDTEDNGYGGMKVASFTPLADTNVNGTSYLVPVDMTGLPYGNYWFYARIDDGRNVPVYSRYSWQVPLRPLVNNSTISVINSSPAVTGYLVGNAIDTNPLTDFVSASGPGSFLDFDFGTAVRLSQVIYTDRVTSGGGNGTFYGGTGDMTTAYTYIISIDNNFTNGDGITDDIKVTRSGIPVPINPKQPSDFSTSLILPGISARYLRWQVDESLGTNAGASNFAFYVRDTSETDPAKDGFAPAGPISGRVIDQINNVGIPGLSVYLDTNGDRSYDAASEPEWTTDGSGYYRFDRGIFKFAQDIGAVGATGTTTASNGNYVIKGSGDDIWGTTDSFQFANTVVKGNTEIVARVVSVSDSNDWAKAGLMFRDGTGPTAAHVLLLQRPDNQVTLQWRDAAGSEAQNIGTLVGGTTSAKWLKLSRAYDSTSSSSTFSAYYSIDGANWTLVGTHTNCIPEAANIGLAVTAHDNTKLSTAQFNNVQITFASGGTPLADGNYNIGVVGIDGLTFVSSTSGGATSNPQIIALASRSFNGAEFQTTTTSQTILHSGTHVLTFESDGTLHLYASGIQTWQSGNSSAGTKLAIQGDGNLVIYGASGPLWASNTAEGELGTGNGGKTLVLSATGNLFINNALGAQLWQTATENVLSDDTNFEFVISNSVGGLVYNDINQNGIMDFGERPALGWTVYADLNNNGVLDNGEPVASSSTDGTYRIFNLPTGVNLTFPVRIDPNSVPGNFTTSDTAVSVTLHSDDSTRFIDNIGFGVLEFATISGTIGNYYFSPARIGNEGVSVIGAAPPFIRKSLITPTSVSVVQGTEYYPAVQLIDNSGLSGTANAGNVASITHAATSDTNAWVTNPYGTNYFADGGPTPVLVFNLDNTYSLTEMVAWNYSVPGNASQRISLSFSTDGGQTFSGAVFLTIPQLAGPAQLLSLGGTYDANAVRVTFLSNYVGAGAGGDRVGLNEIKFMTSEPFDANYSVDTTVDIAEPRLSDYASSGQGTNTYLEFDLGALYYLTSIDYTDRVTSGSASGNFDWGGGIGDFTTGYTYTLSIDSDFTNGDGISDDIKVSVSGLVPPINPAVDDFSAFTSSTNLNITFAARYVRWDVDSIYSSSLNQGASDFGFYARIESPPAGSTAAPPQGWEVQLLQNNVVVQTTTASTTDGSYQFSNVVPGQYTVNQVVPQGWNQSSPVTSNGGGFAQHPLATVNGHVVGSTIFDFNDDAYEDIAVLYTSGSMFYVDVFLNQAGSGTYQQRSNMISQTASGTPFHIEATPYSWYGQAKANQGSTRSGNLGVYFTTGQNWLFANKGTVNGVWQGFSLFTIESVGNTVYSVAVGDVDNDGVADHVYSIPGSNGSYRLQVDSSNLQATEAAIFVEQMKSLGQVALGDINRDGNLDIVIGAATTNANRQTLSIGYGSGDGLFKFQEVYINGVGAGGEDLRTDSNLPIVITDVNSDGLPDISFGFFNNEAVGGGLVLYAAQEYYIGHLVQNSAGGFFAKATSFANPSPMQAFAVGQLRGGTYPDMAHLWKDYQVAGYGLGVFYGGSETVYSGPNQPGAIEGPLANPVDIHLVDLNNDGQLDMVTTDALGTIYINVNRFVRTNDITVNANPGSNSNNNFTNSQQGQIGGVLFSDDNYSGTLDAQEVPKSNLRVFLDEDGDFQYDLGEYVTFTNGLGLFSLNGIADGSYTLVIELPDGAVVTGSHQQSTMLTIEDGLVTDPSKIFREIGIAQRQSITRFTRSITIGKDLSLRSNGGYLELVDNKTGGLLERKLLSRVHQYALYTSNYTSDIIRIDTASGGSFSLPGGIHIDGGRDMLAGGSYLQFQTGSSNDLIEINDTTADMNGLTASWTSNLAKLLVTSGGGNDQISVTGTPLANGTISLVGGTGYDTYRIATQQSKIRIFDNAGTNSLDFSQAVASARINLSLDRGQLQNIGAGNNQLVLIGSFTDLVGTMFSDVLIGNAKNNHIYGLDGDDRIMGMGGNDVLLGGSGNDILDGGTGRNLLIGGSGQDVLKDTEKRRVRNGSILIGGSTIYDNNVIALDTIMAEWGSNKPLKKRISNLISGSGTRKRLNGDYFLNASTLLDDGESDSLVGNKKMDWFLEYGIDRQAQMYSLSRYTIG